MKWPWSKDEDVPPPSTVTEATAPNYPHPFEENSKKRETSDFEREIRIISLLSARVSDLERKSDNQNKGLIDFGHRVDKIEATKTPNQQLIEGFQQIIKKLASMDEEKQYLSDSLRKVYNLLVLSPDWKTEEKTDA